MSTLAHARAGVPWSVLVRVSMPTVALVVVAVSFRGESWATDVVRAGLLLLVTPAAFLLDESSAPAVAASPRSPWWCHTSRLLGLVPLLGAAAVVIGVWTQLTIVDQGGVLLLTVAGVVLSSVATSAVARSTGRSTPGDVVAGAAVVVVLALLLFAPAVLGVELLPQPGSASAQEVALWIAVVVTASGALMAAPAWRPRGAVDV